MFPTDFEAKTSHLTLAEDGAYNRLLRLAWMTPGCSLPADRAWVYRRVRAHTEADQAVIEIVIAEFFELKNGRLSNARLTKEWLAANESHAKRKSAGAKGGKAKALKSNETAPSIATANPKHPEPEPEPTVDTTPIGVVAQSGAQIHLLLDQPADSQPKRAPQPRSASRGSRIPPNWTPTPKDYAFASSEGMTREEINREADRFRDHWKSTPGKGGCKLDWEATWRNWIRSDFRKSKGSSARNSGGYGRSPDPFDVLAAKLQGSSDGPDAWQHDDAGTADGYVIDAGPARLAG